MQTNQYAAEIVKELTRTVGSVAEKEAEYFVNNILRARRIFVAGAGRSGLMIRAFAMRLVHLGFDAYVVGETVTPSVQKDDLLIIGSGSGETKSLVSMAEKAKSIGASLALVTIFPESTIGKLADAVVPLPGSPKDKTADDDQTIQPMGSLFEQTLLVFYDAVILRLMEIRGLDSETMYGKHANLE